MTDREHLCIETLDGIPDKELHLVRALYLAAKECRAKEHSSTLRIPKGSNLADLLLDLGPKKEKT